MSLFGFGGSTSGPDIGAQLSVLQGNANKNRDTNQKLATNLKGLAQPYQAQMTGLTADYTKAGNEVAGNYLSDMGKTTDAEGNDMRLVAHRNINAQVAPQIQAIREAMAAGPGVESSATGNALGQLGTNIAQQGANVETNIDQMAMQNKATALSQTYGAAVNQLSQKLGVDSNMLAGLHAEGRDDLIRQAATDAGITDQETQGILDLLNFKQSGKMAQTSAADSNQTALLGALIGAGGRIAASGTAPKPS